MMPQDSNLLFHYFRAAFSEFRVEPWTCASIISYGLTKHISLSEHRGYLQGAPNRFVFWIPPVIQIHNALTNVNMNSDVLASALAAAIESSIFTIYAQSQIKIVDYFPGPLQAKFQASFRNMVNTPDILAMNLAGACFSEFKKILVTYKTPPPNPLVFMEPLF